MRKANYVITSQDAEKIVLTDIGPWNVHPSVTNAAEDVVAEMLPALNGRRLFYYDSEGELAELKIKDGEFAGFGL